MIDWTKGTGSRKTSIDWTSANIHIPEKKVIIEETKKTLMPDAGTNYQNLLSKGEYNVYGKTMTTPEPKKLQYQPFDSFVKNNIGEQTYNSTKAVGDESDNFGLKEFFGLVRATTDWASLPVSLTANELSGTFSIEQKSGMPQSTPAVMSRESNRVDPKLIIAAVDEMAQKDLASGGEWSMGQAGQMYLKSRNVNDMKDVGVLDVAVLGGLGFSHIFGDILLGVPVLKTAKEFVLWKNVGKVEKPLKEGVTITKGITRDIPIADDLKIKVIPKEKSVVFKGYVRRGAKGEIVNAPFELDTVAAEASKATGKEIVATVKGDDLVLKAVGDVVESTPATNVSRISMAGEELLRDPVISTPEPTIKLDFNAGPQVAKTPTITNNIKEQNIKTSDEIKAYVPIDYAPNKATSAQNRIVLTTEFDVDNLDDPRTQKAKFESEVLFGLENAEPGRRIFFGSGTDREVKAIRSTFPDWIPGPYRRNSIIKPVLEHINNDTLPTKKAELDLYNIIKEDFDNYGKVFEQAEIDINEIDFNAAPKIISDEEAILQKYDKQFESVGGVDKDKVTKGKTTVQADKGEYVEVERSQAETKYQTIETPEQYRLAKSIAPDLNFIMKSSSKFNGYFRPAGLDGEKIAMNRQLYKRGKEESKEQYQTRIGKTMAHEIGHLIDYLPDKNLTRGNLIGRLKVLSDFRKNFVDDPAILDERRKIINDINKIIKDDTLLDSQQDKLTAPLFKKLEAINKNMEFNNPRFKDELVNLSRIWKPWIDGVDPNHDTYRKSPAELYADFVSVLFNDPALAQEKAPTFFKSFFRSLDKKPNVEKEFLSIQAELMGDRPSLMNARYKMLRDSGFNAQKKFVSMVAERQALRKKPWLKAIMTDGWYQHIWVYKKGKNVQNLMEIMDRGFNNEIILWTDENIKPIMKELEGAGLDANDMDAVLVLERIAKDTTRENVANIKGLDIKTAEDVLKDLKTIVGEKEADVLLKTASDLRLALKELQLKFPDIWTPDQIKLMESNDFYAPFNVLFKETNNIGYYIKQSKGNIDKDFSPFVNTLLRVKAVSHFGQKNNIKKQVIDAFLEEGGKDIMPAEVSYIKMANGQLQRNVKKPPINYGLVEIKRDGKIESYYMAEDVAHSLNQDNLGTLHSILRPFNKAQKPFKQLYTGIINPGFQIVNFVFRDWGTTNLIFGPEWTRAALGKSNKGVLNIIANNTYRNILSKLNQASFYWKSFNNIKEKNLFQKYTPIVEEGLKNHIIEIDTNGLYKLDTKSLSEQDTFAIKYILQTMGLSEKGSKLSTKWRQAQGIAQTLEETPKLAAYMYMKKLGILDENNLTVIRNHVGSPNFWKQGRENKNISSLFMFYNPIIRGMENLAKKATIKDYAGKGSRNAFWWRMFRKAIIPALVGVAAEEGMFGDDEKRKWALLPEYLKGSYLNIPIKIDKNGKVVSLSVPLDEEARIVHSLVRNLAKLALNSSDKKEVQRALIDIAAYTGGQIPSPAPVINIAQTWGVALKGGNPYDDFRRQHIFLANELNLPFSEKSKILTKWTLNQSGILKLNLHDSVESRTITEQVVSNTPILQRFIRITNRGEYEADQKVVKEERQKAAIDLMIKKGVVNDLVEKINKDPKYDPAIDLLILAKQRLGDGYTDKELVSEFKTLNNALQEEYITNFGNNHYRSLLNQSNDTKEALLLNIYDRGFMTEKEFNEFVLRAMGMKIISAEIGAEVLMQTTIK